MIYNDIKMNDIKKSQIGQIFKPPTKKDRMWNLFSNLSSGRQYPLNDIKKA